MPQACPNCLWVSSDDAEDCERCGAPLDGTLKPQITANGVGNIVKTVIGLVGLGILATVAVQRLNIHIPNLGPQLKAAAQGFGVWLLGPNEVLKPFIILMLVAPLAILLVLWILARLQ
jgi:hypothetical protein